MTIRKSGKCGTCEKPVVVEIDLEVQSDLLSIYNGLDTDTSTRLRLWRDEAVFCEEHETSMRKLTNHDNI